MNEQPFKGSFFHAIIKIGKKVIITLYPTFFALFLNLKQTLTNRSLAQQSVSRWLSFLSRKGQRSISKGQKRGLKTYVQEPRKKEKLQKQSERKKALPENVYCNFFLQGCIKHKIVLLLVPFEPPRLTNYGPNLSPP